MQTSRQLKHSLAANPLLLAISNKARTISSRFFTPAPVARWIMAGITLALTLFFLLGNTLTTQADPENTVMLPLLMSDGSQTLAANDDEYHACCNSILTVSAEDGVLANDTGPVPDQLQAELESSAANGVLELNEDGSFSYTPDPDFFGQDKFTYRAIQDTAVSNPATVMLTVSAAASSDAPHIVTGEIAFTKQVIGTRVKRAHFAYAADFDEDGDLDIVATQYGKAGGGIGGMVLWYENDSSSPGTANFEEKVLDPDLAGAYPAHVADVNSDNHIDVLVGGYDSDTFTWYRNEGPELRSGANQSSGLDQSSDVNFTRINIDTAADGAHSIITYDLDEDGDVDLVTSGQDGNFISWYENDGANNFQPHIIDDAAIGAKRAGVADIDGDGDPDILGASHDGREIAWYENDGPEPPFGPERGSGLSFSKHVIDDKASGAYYVEPADIDGDGDIDMFSANRRDNTVAWYRNDGPEQSSNPNQRSGIGFTKQIVDDDSIAVRTVVAVDMDHDGDVDALAASVDDDTIAWHENDGTELRSGRSFTKHVIDDSADGVYSASAVDMDFDGDFDLISASRNSGEIALHTHYRAHKASVAKGGTLIINSERLLTVSSAESPADLVYTITGAPKFGEIQLDGTAVPEGGTFTQQDVNDNHVTYAHTAANKASDDFSFSVTGSAAPELQPSTGTFAITIN